MIASHPISTVITVITVITVMGNIASSSAHAPNRLGGVRTMTRAIRAADQASFFTLLAMTNGSREGRNEWVSDGSGMREIKQIS
jgi:hypothetical protein